MQRPASRMGFAGSNVGEHRTSMRGIAVQCLSMQLISRWGTGLFGVGPHGIGKIRAFQAVLSCYSTWTRQFLFSGH